MEIIYEEEFHMVELQKGKVILDGVCFDDIEEYSYDTSVNHGDLILSLYVGETNSLEMRSGDILLNGLVLKNVIEKKIEFSNGLSKLIVQIATIEEKLIADFSRYDSCSNLS